MSIFTSVLNLIKPNATTDASSTFNLDTYLNNNWDKLDAFASKTMTTDNAVNNLAATQPGFYLDARQGPTIQNQLNLKANQSDLIKLINPNLIINGDFRINQRAVSGTVTLASGVYGHDRWKAGSSGCTYTFSTSGGITTINITAGSLIQVIEGTNLQSGNHILSWSGTSQGKIGSGTYSSTGIVSNITGGSNLNIEFGTGTLSNVKIEKGSMVTPFMVKPYSEELALCQRYFINLNSASNPFAFFGYGTYSSGSTSARININVPVTMRALPTPTMQGSITVNTGTSNAVISFVGDQFSEHAIRLVMNLTSAPASSGICEVLASSSTSNILLSAEL